MTVPPEAPRVVASLLEASMELMDMVVVGLILSAFALFAGVLGWAAHVDYQRPEQDEATAGE